jgi:hypothetical protein
MATLAAGASRTTVVCTTFPIRRASASVVELRGFGQQQFRDLPNGFHSNSLIILNPQGPLTGSVVGFEPSEPWEVPLALDTERRPGHLYASCRHRRRDVPAGCRATHGLSGALRRILIHPTRRGRAAGRGGPSRRASRASCPPRDAAAPRCPRRAAVGSSLGSGRWAERAWATITGGAACSSRLRGRPWMALLRSQPWELGTESPPAAL